MLLANDLVGLLYGSRRKSGKAMPPRGYYCSIALNLGIK